MTPSLVDHSIAHRLAGSEDPVVAYQARVLALGADPSRPALTKLRDSIASSSRARALLGGRRPDGTIELNPHAKFQGPHWTLVSLALIDYPPGDPGLAPLKGKVDTWLFGRAHDRVPATVRYPEQPDRVRRCTSQEGNAIWTALRLRLEDEATVRLAERLVALQWPDGGWNCDKRRDARSSSFQETAIPARALWAFGRRFGNEPAVHAAEIADVGRLSDPRCDAALELLESKQLPDGGFPLEERVGTTRSVVASRGTFADWGPAGRRHSNPFVTVRALCVLRTAHAARAGRGGEPDAA